MKNINLKKGINILVVLVYAVLYLTSLVSLGFGDSTIITENLAIVLITIAILGTVFIVNNKSDFIHSVKELKVTDWIILIVVSVLLIGVSIFWQDSLFGIVASLTGVICVVLAAKGSRWTYFWGAINTLLYAIVAYYSSYAGDFALNILFYVPLQFVGLYMWNKHYSDDEDEVEARGFSLMNWIVTIGALVVFTGLMTYAMPVITDFLGMGDNPLPIADSFTTTASVVAQILMVRRFKEQWTLWIVINIFSVAMWVKLGDPAMIVMWGAYLINSVNGYVQWKRNQKSQA